MMSLALGLFLEASRVGSELLKLARADIVRSNQWRVQNSD